MKGGPMCGAGWGQVTSDLTAETVSLTSGVADTLSCLHQVSC